MTLLRRRSTNSRRRGGGTTPGPTVLAHNFRSSSISGAGFQQAMAWSDPAHGHTANVRVSAADVAGFHLSVGYAPWKQCNEGLKKLHYRKLIAVEFDRHNPNCLLAYFSNGKLSDTSDVGNDAGLLYGVIDPVKETISWTVLIDQAVTTGPTYPDGLYPASGEGPNNVTARQTGRMLACDPYHQNRWYVGTRQGVQVITVTRDGNGKATGATVANLARNSATAPRDEVTSVVIGPDSTPTDTRIYFTVRAGGTNGGLNRRYSCGPGQTGTGVLTRYAGTNSLTTAVGAEGVSVELEGGVAVCYVAANQVARKYHTGTGVWTIIDPYTSTEVRWHTIDTARINGDTATRVVIAHYSNDAAISKIAYSDNGGTSWTAFPKSRTTSLIDGTGPNWWLIEAKSYYWLSDLAGEGGWDGSQILLRPDAPEQCTASGRSGLWKTNDITAAGTNWHPDVDGLCATVANWCAPHPTNPTRIIMGDVDWASIRSNGTDRFIGAPVLDEAQLGSPSYQISFLGNAMVRGQGDRDNNNNGGVVHISDPWAASPTKVKLGGFGTNRVWGVGLGTNGSGTPVVIAAVEALGIQRREGAIGTGAATFTTPESSAAPAVETQFKCPVVWPEDGEFVYVLIARPSGTGGGIWRSGDRGLTWTQMISFNNSTRYAGQLIEAPNNKLYFCRKDSNASTTGVFRVDNASGAFTVTRILTLTQPGPIALTSGGRLYSIAEPDDSQGSAMRYTENPTAASPTWVTVNSDFLKGALGFAHHMAFGADDTAYIAKFDGGYLVGDVTTAPAPVEPEPEPEPPAPAPEFAVSETDVVRSIFHDGALTPMPAGSIYAANDKLPAISIQTRDWAKGAVLHAAPRPNPSSGAPWHGSPWDWTINSVLEEGYDVFNIWHEVIPAKFTGLPRNVRVQYAGITAYTITSSLVAWTQVIGDSIGKSIGRPEGGYFENDPIYVKHSFTAAEGGGSANIEGWPASPAAKWRAEPSNRGGGWSVDLNPQSTSGGAVIDDMAILHGPFANMTGGDRIQLPVGGYCAYGGWMRLIMDDYSPLPASALDGWIGCFGADAFTSLTDGSSQRSTSMCNPRHILLTGDWKWTGFCGGSASMIRNTFPTLPFINA